MAQVSGENQINTTEGSYLEPKILHYYKDLYITVHITLTAPLMQSFKVKHMLDNLRTCPAKAKI